MKLRILFTLMLLSLSVLSAKTTQADQEKLLEKAAKLDQYATLSAQEMKQQTDEIHDLIGELVDIMAADREQINHDIKRQVIEYIRAYRKAESEQMASLQNAK